MNEEVTQKYISLLKASQFCEYSQEYLSLRARQGKLKAVKFGRNWVTTKEWLNEYLEKTNEYNNKLNHSLEKEIKSQKFVAPPENLPVARIPVLRFGFIVALVFCLMTASGVFGKNSFQDAFKKLDPYVHNINQDISRVADLVVQDFKQSFKNVYEDFSPVVAGFSENFDRGLAKVIGKTSNDIFVSLKYWEIRTPQLADISGTVKNFSQAIIKTNDIANEFIENKLQRIYQFVNKQSVLEEEKLKTKTIAAEQIEMKDRNTDEIYCAWIENGEWVKKKGGCREVQ